MISMERIEIFGAAILRLESDLSKNERERWIGRRILHRMLLSIEHPGLHACFRRFCSSSIPEEGFDL